jgi:hypothetical protein
MQMVEQIKSKVKMSDVLQAYGLPYQRRMKCPIHNGEDKNFEVKDGRFMCYSHCGGGDVITFVQLMNDCGFKEACDWIDERFALGLYKKPSLTQYREAQKELEKKKREKKELERKNKKSSEAYFLLCDYFKWLRGQEKTPEIEFDINYIERTLEKYADGKKLIEWDAEALINALMSKHTKEAEDANEYRKHYNNNVARVDF